MRMILADRNRVALGEAAPASVQLPVRAINTLPLKIVLQVVDHALKILFRKGHRSRQLLIDDTDLHDPELTSLIDRYAPGDIRLIDHANSIAVASDE